MKLQEINKCQDLLISLVKNKDVLVEIYLSTGYKIYGKIIESDIYSIIFQPYNSNNEPKKGLSCIFKSHITNIYVKENIPFKKAYKSLKYILNTKTTPKKTINKTPQNINTNLENKEETIIETTEETIIETTEEKTSEKKKNIPFLSKLKPPEEIEEEKDKEEILNAINELISL